MHVGACWKTWLFAIMSWEKCSKLLPHKILSLRRKKKIIRNTKISRGGTLTNWVKCLLTHKIFQKSNIILEGYKHPNFIFPYEYGKSYHNKLFPKRIGSLTPPNPKIFGGAPPSLKLCSNRPEQIGLHKFVSTQEVSQHARAGPRLAHHCCCLCKSHLLYGLGCLLTTSAPSFYNLSELQLHMNTCENPP